jgi:hypothetical protein
MCRASQNAVLNVGILPSEGAMRTTAIVALFSLLAAAPAVAQSLGGSPVSYGADIGLFAPFESGASSSFTGRVTADVYSWSPLGLRFALGFANPKMGNGPFEDHFNTIYLSAGLIRAFREGKLHPYGHAGIGIYHLSGDRSGTQLGLTVGGGLELPLGMRHFSATPELTCHVVSGDAPRFSLALTVGLHLKPE